MIASVETGLFRPGQTERDYRVPDLVVSRPENRTRHGVEGRAELVVELRSPGDETYHKLGFYAEMEVQELVVIDPDTCSIELFVLRDGDLVKMSPSSEDSFSVTCLELTLSNPERGALLLAWPGGSTEITAAW